MKEPKIIDRGTAAKLWAEQGRIPCNMHYRIARGDGWHTFSNPVILSNADYEFALIDPEPEIVKPVVVEWNTSCMLELERRDYKLPKAPLVITIRPQSQQTERDRLEREFVESMEAKTIFDPTKAIALRDFIKKEQA